MPPDGRLVHGPCPAPAGSRTAIVSVDTRTRPGSSRIGASVPEATRERHDEVRPSRVRDPDGLVQHPGGPAVRAARGAPPRDEAACRPFRSRAALPDGAHPAGGHARALGGDPGARARGLQALAADAALPRAPPREGAPDAGAHLLQVRGREPGGQPQAEHRGRAGLLQQGSRREAHRHGDGRGPVGQRARVRRAAVRHRREDLHGARQLRPEAVPPEHDGDVGSEGRRLAEPRHEHGAEDARR